MSRSDSAPTSSVRIAAELLGDWLRPRQRLFVLTGAGVSTDSGIPDYRDRDGEWKRAAPITLREFLHDSERRTRYWARSYAGWPAVDGASPNDAHRSLARLEKAQRTTLLVTQNVDGLHSRAGHTEVVDLHGRIDQVICLDCGRREPRQQIQRQMADANPGWNQEQVRIAPDGDADIELRDSSDFRIPVCICCGGRLKPDVVFFGENVPKDRVERAMTALEQADGMLVAGSSLMVYSGFRFARRARELGLPLAILNRGRTRADELATLKLDADCGACLATATVAMAG